MRLFLLTESSVDALTRQTRLSFLLAFFFFYVKFAEKYLGNLCAVSTTIAFHEGGKKKINTGSGLVVFLCLRNTTRTLTAASRRRGYYKYNPPQNTAR